jgi:hypothetical protein
MVKMMAITHGYKTHTPGIRAYTVSIGLDIRVSSDTLQRVWTYKSGRALHRPGRDVRERNSLLGP